MANIVKKIKDEITLENVLTMAMKTPGVKIKRDVFLRKELIKYCPEEVIKEAIRYNPAKAGIGSVASGGLTWVMFKPCCVKLQKNLMTYNLCDPDFYRVVDVESEEIDIEEEDNG